MKYGEKEIKEFDINNKENFWPNKNKNDYIIKITLPEFMCKCPRSGYPDFATIYIEYIPNEKVIELKALKLYINSFMDRYISHEDSINEIFDMLEKNLTAASIQRWNDYPRMIDLVELDKQAHKFIIAYFIAKQEKDVNYIALIESGIFEFLRRVVVTDISKALMQKKDDINKWVIKNLKTSIKDIDDGKFLNKFQEYFTNDQTNIKERFILKAASYLATKWEFSIVYQKQKLRLKKRLKIIMN